MCVGVHSSEVRDFKGSYNQEEVGGEEALQAIITR